jgi:hypothetical protein
MMAATATCSDSASSLPAVMTTKSAPRPRRLSAHRRVKSATFADYVADPDVSPRVRRCGGAIYRQFHHRVYLINAVNAAVAGGVFERSHAPERHMRAGDG